jgi:hypothetical protein
MMEYWNNKKTEFYLFGHSSLHLFVVKLQGIFFLGYDPFGRARRSAEMSACVRGL